MCTILYTGRILGCCLLIPYMLSVELIPHQHDIEKMVLFAGVSRYDVYPSIVRVPNPNP